MASRTQISPQLIYRRGQGEEVLLPNTSPGRRHPSSMPVTCCGFGDSPSLELTHRGTLRELQLPGNRL